MLEMHGIDVWFVSLGQPMRIRRKPWVFRRQLYKFCPVVIFIVLGAGSAGSIMVPITVQHVTVMSIVNSYLPFLLPIAIVVIDVGYQSLTSHHNPITCYCPLQQLLHWYNGCHSLQFC